MFYIYIIFSISADKYYVGHSDDPLRRLIEHNSSLHNTYTSKYRPWVLKAYFPVSDDRGQALIIEKYIKKQKSKKFIELLIEHKDNPDRLALLVRVPRIDRD